MRCAIGARLSSGCGFNRRLEAGTVECEGSFQNGKGSGTFRFTPSLAFVSAMKSRGYDFEKDPPTTEEGRLEDRLFTAATLNVTTALADDLNSANFGKLDVGDLFARSKKIKATLASGLSIFR